MSTTASSILHTNAENTVFVVDVPRSIMEAQRRLDEANLLSCAAMQEPFQRIARQARHPAVGGDSMLDSLNAAKCEKLVVVLQYLKTQCPISSYCYPRFIPSNASQQNSQESTEPIMSIETDDPKHLADDSEGTLNRILSLLATDDATSAKIDARVLLEFAYPNEFMNAPSEKSNGCGHALWQDFIFNESQHTKELVLTVPSEKSINSRFTFTIPPRSAFILGKCEESLKFRAAAREYSPKLNPSKGRFDLIILDPPWPNRSARRKGSYREAWNKTAIEDILLRADLDSHVSPNGFIAIWITNQAAIRELVLGERGLFDLLNVAFIEEWTWLKVTEQGEPILPLGGSFRRPYETLLIGRSPKDRMLPVQPVPPSEILHRTIVGVPDIHSRKPCLKTLFEKCLFKQTTSNYTALEVFARYLVSGWMSWGDEAIKYNCEDFWKKQDVTSR